MSIERQIIERIVDRALELGCVISVYDGEEWCLRGSVLKTTVLNAMFSTDQDTLSFRLNDERKGQIIFIHGNGEDVVHDHTDNEWTSDLVSYGS